MSLAITFRAKLGDDEYSFALTAAVMPEMERATGSGLLAIYRRLDAGEYLASDLVEPIRFGLIGTGTNDAEAGRLVDLYVADRPFLEVYPIACGIVHGRMFGRAAAAAAYAEAIKDAPPPEPDPVPATPPAPVEPAPVADAPSHPGIGSE